MPDDSIATYRVTTTTAGSVHQLYAVSGLLELNQHSAVWSTGSFSETIASRDGAGRILEQTETSGATTTESAYTYDADSRVIEERQDGVLVASYAYDAQGNRTALHRYNAATGAETESRSATYDARDRLLDDGLATYTYDDAGRRASKTVTATGALTRYAYDELGHLTRVALPTGTVVEYTYDALGRRTGRTTDGAVDGPEDTAWVYAGGPAPIAALTGVGTLRATYTYGTRSWVPDMVHIQGGSEPAGDYALVSDHRGSLRALINAATGATLARLDYDAFGRPQTSPSAAPIVAFTFAGGLYDADTGLLHLGARDYDPETGRWIEPDPIRFAGCDTNLYAYVGGDPVNFVDPSGTDAASAAWSFGSGLVVGFVYGAVTGALLAASSPALVVVGVGLVVVGVVGAGLETAELASGKNLDGSTICSEERIDRAAGLLGGFIGAGLGAGAYNRGGEINFRFGGRRGRIAPLGNRSGAPVGEWPHYHLTRPYANPRRAGRGESARDQRQGRHRPWDVGDTDVGWMDRWL